MPSQPTYTETIKDLVKKGRAAAAQAQNWDKPATTQDSSAPGNPDSSAPGNPDSSAPIKTDSSASCKPDSTNLSEYRQTLTLVPYCIVKSLSMLDNIYETRLFGWLLAKAQSVLKLYNKDLSEINIEHALNMTKVTIPARFLLNDGDKNYSCVTKAFSLATKKIDYERDNRVYHLNIIAFPCLVKDGRKSLVTFVIHQEMWHALLDFSKGYRLFSLQTFMTLSCKYSVIMYLLCTQQSCPKSYTTETLRTLLGATNKAYDRGANFISRVLDPAHDELKEKAPYYFEYSATKTGKRHKYTDIIITPVLNKKIILSETEQTRKADEMRLGLDETVMRYCIDSFKITAHDCEKMEPYILRLGDTAAQLSFLGTIKTRVMGGRVKNPAGYLYRSLQQHFDKTANNCNQTSQKIIKNTLV